MFNTTMENNMSDPWKYLTSGNHRPFFHSGSELLPLSYKPKYISEHSSRVSFFFPFSKSTSEQSAISCLALHKYCKPQYSLVIEGVLFFYSFSNSFSRKFQFSFKTALTTQCVFCCSGDWVTMETTPSPFIVTPWERVFLIAFISNLKHMLLW